MLVTCKMNKTVGQRSYFYTGPKYYNVLEDSMKSIKSKRKLREWKYEEDRHHNMRSVIDM